MKSNTPNPPTPRTALAAMGSLFLLGLVAGPLAVAGTWTTDIQGNPIWNDAGSWTSDGGTAGSFPGDPTNPDSVLVLVPSSTNANRFLTITEAAGWNYTIDTLTFETSGGTFGVDSTLNRQLRANDAGTLNVQQIITSQTALGTRGVTSNYDDPELTFASTTGLTTTNNNGGEMSFEGSSFNVTGGLTIGGFGPLRFTDTTTGTKQMFTGTAAPGDNPLVFNRTGGIAAFTFGRDGAATEPGTPTPGVEFDSLVVGSGASGTLSFIRGGSGGSNTTYLREFETTTFQGGSVTLGGNTNTLTHVGDIVLASGTSSTLDARQTWYDVANWPVNGGADAAHRAPTWGWTGQITGDATTSLRVDAISSVDMAVDNRPTMLGDLTLGGAAASGLAAFRVKADGALGSGMTSVEDGATLTFDAPQTAINVQVNKYGAFDAQGANATGVTYSAVGGAGSVQIAEDSIVLLDDTTSPTFPTVTGATPGTLWLGYANQTADVSFNSSTEAWKGVAYGDNIYRAGNGTGRLIGATIENTAAGEDLELLAVGTRAWDNMNMRSGSGAANITTVGNGRTDFRANAFDPASNIDTVNVIGAADGSQRGQETLQIQNNGLKGNREVNVTNADVSVTGANSVEGGSSVVLGDHSTLRVTAADSGDFTFGDGANTLLRLTGAVGPGASFTLGDDTLITVSAGFVGNAATADLTSTRNVQAFDNGQYNWTGDGLVLGDGSFLLTAANNNGNTVVGSIVAAKETGITIGIAALEGRTYNFRSNIQAAGSEVVIGSPDTFDVIQGSGDVTRTTAAGTGVVTTEGDVTADLVTVQSSGTFALKRAGAVRNTDWRFAGPNLARVNVEQANGLGTGTATVEDGVILSASSGRADAFEGATIRLNGGAGVEYSPGGDLTAGGSIIANGGTSTLDLRMDTTVDSIVTFERLDFGAGAQLDVVETRRGSGRSELMTARFVNSVINHSGILNITDAVQTAVDLDDVGVVAGATVTQIGAGDLSINTEFRTELAGSADMLFSTAFTLVDNTGGTGSLSDVTAIFNSTGGLWNLGNAGGAANSIGVSLNPGANLGTIAVGGSATFAEASSGFVEISGLTGGAGYFIDLDLASLSTTIGDVVDELATNGAYSSVAALDADTVRISYSATGTGTGRFAWDNVNSLGANVVAVSVSPGGGGGGSAYDIWAAANGLVGGDALPTADVEPDTLNNLLEFGFGTNPNVSDPGSLVADGSVNGQPIVQISSGPGGDTIEFFFVRRDDHGASGSLTYTVQFSGDLVTWFDSSTAPTFVADSSDDPDYEVVSVPYPALLPDGKEGRLARVVLTEVP